VVAIEFTMPIWSALLAVVQAAAGPLGVAGRFSWRRQAGQCVACGLALAAGGLLAMVQWTPTLELTLLSQRGHGLDPEFFTSFSLRPQQWATMLWPFVRGNPYPLTSLETIGYAGALPLVFAALAPLRRRDRLVVFWAIVVAAAFLLTLGRWNPAYRLLVRVPVFNLFRAPARYLLWAALGIAVLAAVTADSLWSLVCERGGSGRPWQLLGGLVPIGVSAAWVLATPLDGLVEGWRWLPLVWLGVTGLLLAATRWRPWHVLWPALVIGLVLADLGAFNAVYNRTYNATMAPADFERPPDVLNFLWADAGSEPYRIYTTETIVPVLPVMRESLYPNIQVLHGVQSLNGYYPLVPTTQQWLAEQLDARLVDLLNVRYVLIPQLLPVDEATEAYDTGDPFAPSPAGRAFDFPTQSVARLEVEGYLSQSADLADGMPVGQVVLRGAGGEEAVWTLRVGQDLAEWAYDRDDVQETVQHSRPETVRTWPAQSGFPPREHLGRTYLAPFALPQAMQVQHIEVRPLMPRAYLHLERLRLIDPQGGSQLLSTLAGEGDHVLVYRSADVAVYRNEAAGPRAFLVHRTQVASSEGEAEALTTAPALEPRHEAVLLGGRELAGASHADDDVAVEEYAAERVRLRVKTASEAYLVLADSYYPGWTARVDGKPAPIERADVVLRAVAVPPGEHVIEFSFEPQSWRLGGAVSIAAWLGVVMAALWRRRS
nr:YfhO family protein [Anaerolineae bacterium]